jgi:hypothetical protein
MKLWVTVVLALVCVGACAPAASAFTVSAEQKIIIRARVLPSQYVIINDQGRIIEIGSNTDQSVTPRVFMARVTAGSERPLSGAIYAQYKELLPAKIRPGILYKYQPLALEAPTLKLSI